MASSGLTNVPTVSVVDSVTDPAPSGSAQWVGSPADGFERGQVRKKRKTLACYDCRRRKLKCDREYPTCGRCIKGGHPESCLYEDAASDTGNAHAAVADHDSIENGRLSGYHRSSLHGRRARAASPAGGPTHTFMEQMYATMSQQQATIAQMQNKILTLEAKMMALHHQDFNNKIRAAKPDALLTDGNDNTEADPTKEAFHDIEPFMIRGQGYKTKFYGSSDVQALLLQFRELEDYIKEHVVTSPRLQEVRYRSKNLRKFHKQDELGNRHPKPVHSGENLARLMPPREIADMLVHLYLNSFAMLYAIVHKQRFIEQYRQYWQDPNAVPDNSLAILLLAMATVRTISAHSSERITFVGLKSSLKLQAETWIGEVESWLEKRSAKHAVRQDFQVKCLLVIAKLTSMVKVKRSFTDSGTLLRWGMSAGLHRNCAVRSKELKPFDFEFRQRLWAFMKLWDLQACIERGMPIWPGELGANDTPPLNIDDDDLEKECETLPTSRPREEFTDASYLRISQEHFSLRSGITVLINTARSYVDYNEVLAYDAKLTETIHGLPKWIDEKTSEAERLRRALPQFLLEDRLRQCQIMLHRPYMRVSTTNPRYAYSRNICLESSATILDKLNGLPKILRDVAFHMNPDFYRATFTLCQSLYVSSLVRTDPIFNATRESLCTLIQQALCVLEEKVLRSGNGMDQHWLLQAAYCLLQTKGSPGRVQEYLQCFISRVVWVHDHIAGLQTPELARSLGSSSVEPFAATPAFDGTADHLDLFDFLELPDLTPEMLNWDSIEIDHELAERSPMRKA